MISPWIPAVQKKAQAIQELGGSEMIFHLWHMCYLVELELGLWLNLIRISKNAANSSSRH
jgi:hypothetical protein